MPKISSKPAMRTIPHSLSVGTVAGGKPGPPTGVTLFDAADRALCTDRIGRRHREAVGRAVGQPGDHMTQSRCAGIAVDTSGRIRDYRLAGEERRARNECYDIPQVVVSKLHFGTSMPFGPGGPS